MPNYGDPRYWEERYKSQNKATFDWLENYDTLKPLLANLIDKHHKILNIGCGNAELTEAMYDDGYSKIINMDISATVIQQMADRNKSRPGLGWEVADVLDMHYEGETFDVVLDKSKTVVIKAP